MIVNRHFLWFSGLYSICCNNFKMDLSPCCLTIRNTKSNTTMYCSLKGLLTLHVLHSMFKIFVASEPSCSAENRGNLHHVLKVGYFMGWKPEHSTRKVLCLVFNNACWRTIKWWILTREKDLWIVPALGRENLKGSTSSCAEFLSRGRRCIFKYRHCPLNPFLCISFLLSNLFSMTWNLLHYFNI